MKNGESRVIRAFRSESASSRASATAVQVSRGAWPGFRKERFGGYPGAVNHVLSRGDRRKSINLHDASLGGMDDTGRLRPVLEYQIAT